MDPVVRRYLIMNAFDGLMTALGVLLGAWLTGSLSAVPHLVTMGGVAMFVSGVAGAYMTERAEREREIRELEKHLGRSLRDTDIEKKRRKLIFLSGVVDGLSPMAFALLSISPFFLLPPYPAFQASLILCAILLVALGLYLARVSEGDPLEYALKMLAAGGIVVLFSLFLGVTPG